MHRHPPICKGDADPHHGLFHHGLFHHEPTHPVALRHTAGRLRAASSTARRALWGLHSRTGLAAGTACRVVRGPASFPVGGRPWLDHPCTVHGARLASACHRLACMARRMGLRVARRRGTMQCRLQAMAAMAVVATLRSIMAQ